ncbi:MAG: LPS-assembly protein LptD, partial [Verrucomicrobia bacterium]|nr:LPS-assembly protein LptD [Verrucomicrobiota bacterium]
MKSPRLPLLALLLCLAAAARAASVTNEPVWEIESPRGEVSYDARTGLATATNGAVVHYGAMLLTADWATLNQETGDVQAYGHVFLQREKELWRGEHLLFNFKTRHMEGEEFRTGANPYLAQGKGLSANPTNHYYTATGALVTTDDISNPGYYIRGKRMTIVPNDYIDIEDAVLYLGNVPVFYYPRLRRHLGRHANNFEFTPGYRSTYGPFLLTTLNSYWSTNLSTDFHLDERIKRGVGLGLGADYDLGSAGQGRVEYYYTHDLAPGTNIFGADPIRKNRDRFKLNHDIDLATNFTAKVGVNYQRDPQIIRDFFEGEYQKNLQPASFLEVQKLWSNFSLNFYAQPQINSFSETVERLPEVRFTGARQQLGISPFYYESETSLGWYRHNFATNFADFEAWRADSHQELLLPMNYFGWLNLTPRAGGRYTHYSETTGFGTTQMEANRWVFDTGAELSTKASRTWPTATNGFFQIDGIRHIVEPGVNYIYVPSPTKLPPQLPQFDGELPSVRPLPIDFPGYNSIDSIDSQSTMRFGLRNKIQTHRDGQIENVVDWNAFTDWRLQPRVGQRTWGDSFSDLDLRPRSWLTLNSEIRANISENRIKEANHFIYLQPATDWSLSLGHRYFAFDPALGLNSDHNLFET